MTAPYKIISNKPSNILEIAWDPSNFCNFKCRYCFEGSNAATHKNPQNIDLVVDNFRYLMDYYTNNLGKNKFQYYIAGGEPTLWKDLGVFIEKIKSQHDVYFTLVSNGSRTLRWWEEYANVIDNAHLSHHLAQGNVEHITKVADVLHKNGAKVTVKVLMDPDYWDQGINDVLYMKNNSIHSWFIMASKIVERGAFKSPNYTEEQNDYLKKDLKRIPNLKWFWKNRRLLKEEIRLWESKAYLDDGSTINARPGAYLNRGWSNFKDWNCNIGIERVYIGWNGNISGSCQAKLFGLDYYFNILDLNFKANFKPKLTSVICPNNGCWCLPETHVSKSKIIVINQQ